MNEPSTNFIYEQLINSDDLEKSLNLIDQIDAPINHMSFSDFFNNYIGQHPELKVSQIIKDSNISKSYAHEIINGDKPGSRDRIIALCYSANMNMDEVKQALLLSQNQPLYAKSKRDIVIMHGINHKETDETYSSVIKLNIILEERGLLPLQLSKS